MCCCYPYQSRIKIWDGESFTLSKFYDLEATVLQQSIVVKSFSRHRTRRRNDPFETRNYAFFVLKAVAFLWIFQSLILSILL